MNNTTIKHFALITHFDFVTTTFKIQRLTQMSGKKQIKYKKRLIGAIKHRMSKAVNEGNFIYIEKMLCLVIYYSNNLFVTNISNSNFKNDNPSIFFDEIMSMCSTNFDTFQPSFNKVLNYFPSVYFYISYVSFIYRKGLVEKNGVIKFIKDLNTNPQIVFKILYMLFFCYPDTRFNSNEILHLQTIVDIYDFINFKDVDSKKLPDDFKIIEVIFKELNNNPAIWTNNLVTKHIKSKFSKLYDTLLEALDLAPTQPIEQPHSYLNRRIQKNLVNSINFELYPLQKLLNIIFNNDI